MTRGATWATCPHYKYPKKYLMLSFGLSQTVRERVREREREKRDLSSIHGISSMDLVRSRIKADLRDNVYAWIPESQDSAKVQGSGFHRNREKAVSQESTPFEVGFSPTGVNFCLRAWGCVQGDAVQFFSLTL